LVSQEIAEFREIWEKSSSPEQAVLAAFISLKGARGVATVHEIRTVLAKAGARVPRSRGDDLNHVTGVLDRLAQREVLDRLGAHTYRFRVTLLRDWLGERIDVQDVARHARWTEAIAEQSPGGAGVSKLPIHKKRHPWHKRQPVTPGQRPVDENVAAAADREVEEHGWLRAVGRRGGWILLVGVLLVALAAGLAEFPLAVDPTPTAQPSPQPTAQLTGVIQTPLAQNPIQPTPGIAPTSTPRPSPSPTTTPTPPLVLARTVPSLAYQSSGAGEESWSIYTMNSDGSNRTRISDGQTEFLSAPAWSPDGSQLAVVSDRDGAPDIWVMNSDGSDPTNITRDSAKDHSPAWSPDGQWIAFASVRDALYWELYLIRPDGSDLQRLTWWEDASDLWPTWSPDGTRLAFASKRDGNWEIYTMDRNGSNLVRLTDHPGDDTRPAWSPEGSRIAFESTRDGYAEIYVLPVAGGEAVNLTQTSWATELGPTWSPDGGRIAFYADRDGDWDIYVMNSDGSGAVKLTGNNSNDQVPAWRP
jgi:Tol biopolymer transport system component